MTHVKVVIIGAGQSGIAAARTLRKARVAVLIVDRNTYVAVT